MADGPPRAGGKAPGQSGAWSTPAGGIGLVGHVNYMLVMRSGRDGLVAVGLVPVGYQAAMICDELEEGAGWMTVGIARVLAGEQARAVAAATGGWPAENLLPAAWRRVSLAARICAVAARGWRTLAEQEGGTQMRTITSFLLPARTSCTRSFRHVQLSVPPRQAAV
jgi:hypothetical protein